MRLQILCPAKINPFLAVGKPDAIGYHPVRTILQAVSLADTLWVEEADRDRIEGWDELPADNTISKALRLLREFADVPPLSIGLDKRIPCEAGLGGGSSDAGGLLRAVNRFAPIPYSPDQLREVARAIGVDTPFFLVGGRARGTGYGEIVEPLPDLTERWLAIAKPSVGSPTADAYRKLDAMEYEFRDFPSDDAETYNDFERAMSCESADLIEELLRWGASASGLTGSGSAVFGYFPDSDSAERAAAGLDGNSGVRAWAVRTLTRSESLALQVIEV